MGYILGLGGNCCDNCTSNNPCLSKPILTACSSGSGTVGVYGTWLSYTSGTNLASASWATSGAPSGIAIDSSGYLYGTPTAAANTNITIIAFNDCGQSTCTFPLSIAACPTCSFSQLFPTLDGDTGTFSTDYPFSSFNTCARTVYVASTIDAGTLTANLYADGVLVYTSGSISGNTTGSGTVPAGTTTLTFEIVITSPVGPDTYFDIYC